MIKKMKNMMSARGALALAILADAKVALASSSTGLPWETPLQTIVQSLQSPVAFAIAVGALFAAGAALVFGEDMSGFVRKVLLAVMAIALLVGGSAFLSRVFGVSGALVS